MQITFSTSFFLCPSQALLIYLASAFHNIRKQMLNKLIKRSGWTDIGGVIMVEAYINNTRMPKFLIKKLPLLWLHSPCSEPISKAAPTAIRIN